MYIPETSTQYMFLPVYGPPGVDLTQYPVQVALVPEDAGEPAPSAYQPADWIQGRAGLLSRCETTDQKVGGFESLRARQA
jgi:hypothetical protein